MPYGFAMRIGLLVLFVVTACGRIGFDPSDAATDIALTLSPDTAVINVSTSLRVTANGGVAPYTFASSSGSIDGNGLFFSPAVEGMAIVEVADAVGARATAQIRIQGNRLFLIGGVDSGGRLNEVLASADGTTFALVGALPTPRDSGIALVFENRLFYLGGDTTTGASADVLVSSNGVTWSVLSQLPVGVKSPAAVVHDREIWVIGGLADAGDQAEVWHSSDGVNWIAAGMLPNPRHELEALSFDNQLYVIGGHGGTLYNDVLVRQPTGAWSQAGTLGLSGDWAASAIVGPRVFHTGGTAGNGVEVSTDLMTWTACAPLTAPITGPGMVGFGGRLYVIGNVTAYSTTDCAAWSIVGGSARSQLAAVAFTPQ